MVGLAPREVSSFLPPVKDDLGLKIAGIYICECGEVYNGQTGHSIETRIKEHHQHIINLGHCIQFQDTGILATRSRHTEHITREATELELHPDNMNRKEVSP
jgi:hypothetical protein